MKDNPTVYELLQRDLKSKRREVISKSLRDVYEEQAPQKIRQAIAERKARIESGQEKFEKEASQVQEQRQQIREMAKSKPEMAKELKKLDAIRRMKKVSTELPRPTYGKDEPLPDAQEDLREPMLRRDIELKRHLESLSKRGRY